MSHFGSTWAPLALFAVAACAHSTPAEPATPAAAPSPSASPAEPPESGTVAAGCGFVFVGNTGNVSLTAFLPGRRAQRVEGNPYLYVLDDMVVELRMTTAAEMDAGAV